MIAHPTTDWIFLLGIVGLGTFALLVMGLILWGAWAHYSDTRRDDQ